MQVLRHFVLPIGLLFVLIALMVVGFSSAQSGWIALGMLCLWPLIWGVAAWTIRGLKDSFELVPRAKVRTGQEKQRRPVSSNEVFP